MAGTTYDVIVALKTEGSLSTDIGGATSKLSGLESAAGRTSGALMKIGSGFAESFTGAVERGIGMLAKLGAAAGAGVFGGAIYGVKGLNSELEISKMSVAAVLNAQGVSATMPEALARAGGLVKQMQIDARDLPGEFSDLFGIFQTGIGSAIQSGMTDESFRQLSAKTMAAAKALAVPMDQAGRELSRLMMGSAGMDNTLGMRLGLDANATYKDLDGISKKFKDLSAEGRGGLIEEKLGKFGPSIEAFGQTFDAQFSTVVDNVKQFIGRATGPLFESVKGTLGEINNWFTTNQPYVELYADKVGYFLVNAFEKGKAIVVEWGPLLVDFAGRAYDKIMGLWNDVGPAVSTAAGYVKEFLGDPAAVDKMITLLKLYLLIKGGGMAMDMVSGAGSLLGLSGGKRLLQMAGGGGGGVAAARGVAALGTEETAFAAAVRTGPLMTSLGTVAAKATAAIGAAGVGFSAFTAGVLALPVLAIGQTGREIYNARDKSETLDARPLKEYSEGANKFADGLRDKGAQATIALDIFRETGVFPVTEEFKSLEDATFSLGRVIKDLGKDYDAKRISEINKQAEDAQQERLFQKDASEVLTGALSTMGTAAAGKALESIAKAEQADTKAKEKKPSLGGGTVIGSVHITVTSNAEPGQIVRKSLEELSRVRRIPTSSSDIRNFSAR